MIFIFIKINYDTEEMVPSLESSTIFSTTEPHGTILEYAILHAMQYNTSTKEPLLEETINIYSYFNNKGRTTMCPDKSWT